MPPCSNYVIDMTIGSGGQNNSEFSNPGGCAVDSSSGMIYVTDEGNHRVQV